ncbi:MAG: hypothetical protein ACD_71C00131G0003 [uncultured bacterium (gcode 4)]|uniref:Resolvase protein n=1 Tax=uncultured bacterium (gcode 4) TaxID=1234023 RepID=K1ZJ37_9BACT|nr:MAG: hypothetical protein ACD_71C00131G0003 [uncultured bacterium (gcode 4)]
MEQKKRVAIYTRVSTLDWVRGTSLENQEEVLKLYIESHKYEGWELIPDGVFSEKAISGYKWTDERPELMKVKQLVMKKGIDILLIYRIDRLARNTSLLLDFVKDLEKYKVELVSRDGKIDTTSPNGWFFLTILAAMAQMERSLIMERTYSGKIRRMADWYYVWGKAPPLGFKVEKDKKISVDEVYAPVIREIFNLCIKWNLPKEIADEMNLRWQENYSSIEKRKDYDKKKKEGKTKEGDELINIKWTAEYIRQIIGNEMYKGIYHFWKTKIWENSKWKEVSVPASRDEWIPVPLKEGIVDEVIWEKANEQIKKRNKIERGRWKSHIFTWLIKCGFDWLWYTYYKRIKKKVEYWYYRCGWRNTSKHGSGFCFNLPVPEKELYTKCMGVIRKFIDNPKEMYSTQIGDDQVLESQKQKLYEDLNAEIKRQEEEKKKVIYYQDKEAKSLWKSEEEQKLAQERTEEAEKAFSVVVKRIKEIKTDISLLELQAENKDSIEKFAKTYRKALNNFTEEQGTEIIRMLVDKIVVKGTKIDIYFRFRPHPESLTNPDFSLTDEPNPVIDEGVGENPVINVPNLGSVQIKIFTIY